MALVISGTWSRIAREARGAAFALLVIAGAGEEAMAQDPGPMMGPILDEGKSESTDSHPKHRFMPLLGNAARDRGFSIPRPYGLSAVVVDTHVDMTGQALALSLATGEGSPPQDLVELPQVSVRGIDNYNTSAQAKFDLYLFPFLNLFVSMGKVKGHADIALDVDLDELLPPLFCRFNPCGKQPLDFTVDLDNTATTFGGTLAVGGNFGARGHGWFVTGTATRTLTVASTQRSDIKTTSLSTRAGMRLKLGREFFVGPYAGLAYYDLKARVYGVAQSYELLDNGPRFAIRYRFDIDNPNKYSAVLGVNVELSRAISLQAEVNRGAGHRQVVASANFRF